MVERYKHGDPMPESLLVRRTFIVVASLSLVTVAVLLGTYKLKESMKPQATAATASALVPLLPSPTAKVALAETEAEQDPALRSHWKAIERCFGEGRVPVMGYNYGVICLHKSNVAWTQYDKLPF
jgi:hypothetical protein